MHKKRSKKIPYLQLAIAAVAAFAIVRGYCRLTDDFRLSNMTHPMVHRAEWEVSGEEGGNKNLLNSVLSQEFSYIGKGAQSYVFGSDDGKYVLKFFKFKHLKPSIFVEMLPDCFPFQEYRSRQIARKQRKLYGVFNGYRLAYEKHRKESGLLYIHLNVTEGTINKKVKLIDKIGLSREVDLDAVTFVLQERAVTSRNLIDNHLRKGELDNALASIFKLLDLYRSEYAKGILDHDHGVMHNTGFVGSRPIHLDVGKLYDEPSIAEGDNALQDLTKVAVKIARNVKEKSPEHYASILKEMERYISNAYDQPAFSLEQEGPKVGFPL